ncbi:E3 ubiquitin-protein ligase ZNF598 [Protopterus annectens]|uniref:E3 ubiquitin-protein ligase ZNF598 n=1 Tax=Protopterus annectens TaxID=7888 RepID=UPI001CFBC666|nr:E3 ubiquitin-protein ligase ZNF598 [Protopterus annectens]
MAAVEKVPDNEGNCVLCCQDLELLALGKCDHPVCYRCSTKMRVLCDQRYCAVCREELDKVIFTRRFSPFSTIETRQFHCDKRYNIFFVDAKAQSDFRRLLKHECFECPETRSFYTVEELEHHMRKQHELFCCKLCVKHLKIFTYERKWYNRKDLARHRIHGDPDNTSHRGHPLCKFCDERYLDNDELLKHLRKDHYFCHFCDSEGTQDYYSDYEYLKEHFRDQHFLCEEGSCFSEQFTHAFRTEIDFRAHKAAYHIKNRAEARQNRQIDLQFNYTPRNQRRNEGVISGEDYEEIDRFSRHGRPGRGGTRGGQSRRGSWRYNREEEDRDVAAAVRASLAARRQKEGNRAEDKDTGNTRRQREGNLSEDKENCSSRRQREGHQSDEKECSNPRKQREVIRSEEKDSGNTRRQRDGNRGELRDKDNADEEVVVDYTIKHAAIKNEELRDTEELHNLKDALKPSGETGSRETKNTVSSCINKDDFPVLGSGTAVINCSSFKTVPVELKEEDFPCLSSTGSVPPSAGITAPYVASTKKTSSFQEEDFPALVPKIKPHNPVSSCASAWSSSSNKKMVNPLTRSNSSCSQTVKKCAPVNSNKGGVKNKKSSLSDDEDSGSGLTAQEIRSAPTMFDISSLLTPSMTQTVGKVGKKKKVGAEKQTAPVQHSENHSNANIIQKQNTSDAAQTPGSISLHVSPPVTNTLINGYSEKLDKTNNCFRMPPGFKNTEIATPSPLPEEEFPALGSPALPRKPPPGFTSAVPLTTLNPSITPAPPPGLSVPLSKPPPGFTDALSTRDLPSEPVILPKGQISATEYYRSCRDLLGESFRKLFNELLVLLPDVAKQQELLSAHNDFRITEKQKSNKSKKKKKNVWQTDSDSELGCQICVICKQVLTTNDFISHEALHNEDDEFPSLQSISRIIS